MIRDAYTLGCLCCSIGALVCDVRSLFESLFDEESQGCVKKMEHDLRALDAALDQIRPKLRKVGIPRSDREEECMTALDEIAKDIREAIGDTKSFYMTHGNKLLYSNTALTVCTQIDALHSCLDDNRQCLQEDIYYGLLRASQRAEDVLDCLNQLGNCHSPTKQRVHLQCKNGCTAKHRFQIFATRLSY